MNLVSDPTPDSGGFRPPATDADGTRGPRIPDDWCRQCWSEHLVWRDGVWMAEHIEPLAGCAHSCHDGHTFLDSTS